MTSGVLSGFDLRVLRATDGRYVRSAQRIGWLALTEPGLAFRCLEALRELGLVEEMSGSGWSRTRSGDETLEILDTYDRDEQDQEHQDEWRARRRCLALALLIGVAAEREQPSWAAEALE